MRLSPESLKVETFATEDLPEQVGYASSNTGEEECSSACRHPTCKYEICG